MKRPACHLFQPDDRKAGSLPKQALPTGGNGPTWRVQTPVRDLCDGDFRAALRVEVWEASGGGRSSLLGSAVTNLRALQSDPRLPLSNAGKVSNCLFPAGLACAVHAVQQRLPMLGGIAASPHLKQCHRDCIAECTPVLRAAALLLPSCILSLQLMGCSSRERRLSRPVASHDACICVGETVLFIRCNAVISDHEIMPGQEAGALGVADLVVRRRLSFLDYMAGGCEINFMCAIDFSGANAPPADPASGHYAGPDGQAPSVYERAMAAMGATIQFYDPLRSFPLWGFGGQVGCPFFLAASLNSDMPWACPLLLVSWRPQQAYSQVQAPLGCMPELDTLPCQLLCSERHC